MAENTATLEQKKYLQSIVGTSDPTNMNPFDQSQPGLSGSGEPEQAEKDLVDLPFRFTQWQLNQGNKAASGQWDRSATARSPYQSGQLALEMEGIQGQLKNLPEMNAAPVPPTLPEIVPEPQAASTSASSDNLNTNMRYGLPLKEYQIPSNMILGSRNPIEAARSFESKYKTPEERAAFGPTTAIQGYDIDAIMKASGWGGNLTEQYQGEENKSTQTMFNNLAILPSTFDPNLSNKDVQQNLVEGDFTFNPGTVHPAVGPEGSTYMEQPSSEGMGISSGFYMPNQNQSAESGGGYTPVAAQTEQWQESPEQMSQQFNFGKEGEAGTVGQTGFGDFERQVQETIAREIHNGSAISKVAMKYGMAATLAVMAAMSGGAASAAFAPAAGAAAGATAGGTEAAIGAGVAAGADVGMAPAATGLAGTMGMSSGALATTVNNIASMIAKYGVTAAAQAAGVPVDNPIFQMAMSAAGGAYSGATGAPQGTTGTTSPPIDIPESDFIRGDINMGGLDSQQISSPADYGMSEGMSTPRNVFANDSGLIQNIPVSNINYQDVGNRTAQFGLKVGLSEAQAAQMEADQAGQPNAGSQMTYDNEMTAYNTALEEYNREVASYEAYRQQLEERSAEVQRLMGAYETDTGNWASRQALTARQTGIQQQIRESIAGNTAYDTKAMSTGVQGALWK
jgi:hypothetical protein